MKRIMCTIAVFSLLVLPSVFGGDLTARGTATGLVLDCQDQTDTPVCFSDNGDDHPWDIDTPTDPDSLFAIPDETISPIEYSGMREAYVSEGDGSIESSSINRSLLDIIILLLHLILR
ncbi:MAG: hypothetical protein JW763_07275 [candidate division Zixibacteria bacterium]|nr:hypothetical protein [candidate division Zixibacteria bacterium]